MASTTRKKIINARKRAYGFENPIFTDAKTLNLVRPSAPPVDPLPTLPLKSYEERLRARGSLPWPHWAAGRAGCGCPVTEAGVFEDPRNTQDTLCYHHAKAIVCAGCGGAALSEITRDAVDHWHEEKYCAKCAQPVQLSA